MALLRGQLIGVPAYCYPRYDYLSERADTLIKYFERLAGSTKFRRCLDWAKEKRRKPLKSKLNLFVFFKKEDSDFFKSKQFLVKDADKEYKTRLGAIPRGGFRKTSKPTRIDIIVLSGELSEESEEVDFFRLKKFPQQNTYFVSKDNKMCCKMEDISNRDQWTGNLSHLVQSGLEKTVMDVVKQMEQLMTEFISDERAHKLGHIRDSLGHLDDFPDDFRGFGGLEETYKNDEIKRIESRQREILKRIHRLQFLTHALLRQSPLTCNDIKEPMKLPKELQQDLLKKPFVTGCGTIFGELVIHVKSDIREEQSKDIEDCLKPYGSLFPYKVEVFVPVYRKTVGQGDCIRAEKLTSSHDEKYNHSSLGCFVNVKIKESDQEEVHFITCHHCLNDCSDEVSVWGQNIEYEDLGLKKHSHKAADIALVQVIKPHLISKGLKYYDGKRKFYKWQFYQDGEYLGRQVYKVGATSGTTKGYIASDNYLLNPEILADELPPNLFLIASYSDLNVPVTEQRAAAVDVQHPFFSYEGDSGSVVCDINPDSGDGLVLGLLHGFMFDVNNPERNIFSYASNMKSALNMLKEKHPDIESIEPSLDQDKCPALQGASAF